MTPGVSLSTGVESSDVLMRAQNLHTFYAESHVLHDVSLTIREGEAVGLLGRNGMGKTTLIRTIMGWARPSSGTVLVRAKDETFSTPDRIARSGIAYVPEGRGIFPNLTVRENLMVAARPGFNGQRRWTLERVLSLFPRLAQRVNFSGHQLSGGEQQMLAIGRALTTNPSCLILDEATEGLAPLIVRDVWRVLGELRAAGMAALIVDGSYQRVLRHTHRAIILEKGRVALSGPSAHLLAGADELHRLLGV